MAGGRIAGTVLAAAVALATVAGPADATVRKGAAQDRTGDSTQPGAGWDLAAVAAEADDAGRATVAVKLRAAPPSSAYVIGWVGTSGPQGCASPLALFMGHVGTGEAAFSTGTNVPSQPAQMQVQGDTVTLSAQHASLARAYDCAMGAIATAPDPDRIVDVSDSPAQLVAEPPPPAATPAPTPEPPPPAAPPVPVAKAAKLAVSLSGAPKTIRRNRTITLRLRVANEGSQRSGRIRIGVAKARGLSVRAPKPLAALRPAQRRTLKLRVKLTARAKAATTVKVTVRAGKTKATSSLLLRIGKPKAAKPKAGRSPIVGTYWWRTENHVDWAWDNRALYFVDGRSVYSGFPKGGLPAACKQAPAEPEGDIDDRDGCLTYTFDARTGAVTIDGKTGTFRNGKLIIDGSGYIPLHVPAAGSRYDITEHRHFSFQGMCGLILGCTTTQQYLSLSPAGQFILSRSSMSTMGDPAWGPWTAVHQVPPDQHGTYEVQAGGRIQLSFADGTARVETFAVDTVSETGRPDPVGEGVLIGDTNFYPPRD